MFQNLKQLYAAAICFTATMIIMICSGLVINSLTELGFTEYKHLEYLGNFESNERYIDHKKQLDIKSEDSAKISQMSTQEITVMRTKERTNYIDSKKNHAKEKLFDYFGWIIISSLFLMVHWKIVRVKE